MYYCFFAYHLLISSLNIKDIVQWVTFITFYVCCIQYVYHLVFIFVVLFNCTYAIKIFIRDVYIFPHFNFTILIKTNETFWPSGLNQAFGTVTKLTVKIELEHTNVTRLLLYTLPLISIMVKIGIILVSAAPTATMLDDLGDIPNKLPKFKSSKF